VIPFLSLVPGRDAADVRAAIDRVVTRGWFVLGPELDAFEKEFAVATDSAHAVGVNTGTDALALALRALDVGPGDEVITAPVSAAYTALAIMMVGARPVFADIDPDRLTLDPAATAAAITPRTKAIIPTHWPGSLVDMDALLALARRHGLRVIEDAALVLGSRWKGTNVGAFGDLVTFSFHPNKNITSIEGGALVVNDAQEAARVDPLRFHGITYLPDRTRDVAFPGGKFNLPDVNARIGIAQLARLPEFLAKRRALVDGYFERFATDPPCLLPPRPEDTDGQSWNMWSVLLPLPRMRVSRKDFRDAMQARGIGTGVSYEALHLTTLGRRYGYGEGDFPVTERIARETVTLPLHPAMSADDVDRVCAAAAEILAVVRK
jgi:hypothetical protein